MITEIIFTNPEETAVIVNYGDGSSQGRSWPAVGNGAGEIYVWLESNSVTPYNEFYGLSDDDLKVKNYAINAELAQVQILAAEANPIQGIVLDERGTRKENGRRANRAKGLLKLTDNDDALADHIDLIMDALDTGDDAVEALNDRQALENWDGSSIIWPVWSPPV